MASGQRNRLGIVTMAFSLPSLCAGVGICSCFSGAWWSVRPLYYWCPHPNLGCSRWPPTVVDLSLSLAVWYCKGRLVIALIWSTFSRRHFSLLLVLCSWDSWRGLLGSLMAWLSHWKKAVAPVVNSTMLLTVTHWSRLGTSQHLTSSSFFVRILQVIIGCSWPYHPISHCQPFTPGVLCTLDLCSRRSL